MADVFRRTYKPLSAAQTEMIDGLKSDAALFYQGLETLGESREIALAKTKIEEAVFWATKHITR